TGASRSTGGGARWAGPGLATTGAVGRIRIDPTNPQRIFVAAQGRLFDTGGDRGLYPPDEWGAPWRQVLAGINNSTGAIDVAVSPADPDIVVAALWDKLRFPDGRPLGGEGAGGHTA